MATTMTTTGTMYGLSDTLQKKVLAFLCAGKTGNITFNVKDGRVLSWQFTEFGRPCIDKDVNFHHTR